MNCINLKQKLNRTLYCKKLNKQINIKECSNCKYREYKVSPVKSGKPNRKPEYKYKPKKGKCNRYYNDISIMPKSKLYSTIKIKGLEKHHIFGGVANRPKSEEYGLFIWLTKEQHQYFHDNPLEMIKIKKIAQATFMEYYNKSIEDFIDIFGKSYL